MASKTTKTLRQDSGQAGQAKEKTATKKPTVAKAAKESTLTIGVYGLDGKKTSSMSLPEEIFGAKVNKALMSQAVRVYLANQRQGTVATQTRGEVTGSTRKIYRQKGTGRARHGGVRAPIFVGGGVVFGPKPKDYSLKLSKKMRKAALFSALSTKYQEGSVRVLTGLERIEPKTKNMVTVLEKLALADKKRKILLVIPETQDNVTRAVRNIKGVTYAQAGQMNTYDVLNHKQLVFMRGAIDILKTHFLKGEAV